MTPIAGTAVTSERSDCAWAGAPVFKSTVLSGDISVEIGFIATRSTSGSPVVMPPSVPPARFVARASPGRISSCTSEPLRRAASKPRPRLARARPLEDVARVLAVVLQAAGEVGVPGPGPGDLAPPLGAPASTGGIRLRCHHVLPVLPV